jgi:hypothetical protein
MSPIFEPNSNSTRIDNVIAARTHISALGELLNACSVFITRSSPVSVSENIFVPIVVLCWILRHSLACSATPLYFSVLSGPSVLKTTHVSGTEPSVIGRRHLPCACSDVHVVREPVTAFEGHEHGENPPCESHIGEGGNRERRDDKCDRPEDFCGPNGNSRPVHRYRCCCRLFQ